MVTMLATVDIVKACDDAGVEISVDAGAPGTGRLAKCVPVYLDHMNFLSRILTGRLFTLEPKAHLFHFLISSGPVRLLQ